ncbi:interleukin-6 receptor subunit beta-like [Spheniscus humboldti]
MILQNKLDTNPNPYFSFKYSPNQIVWLAAGVFLQENCCVPPEDTASPRTSFSVQGLRPYTEYVFSIRCMKEDGVGYWSDWSEEKTGVTTEDTFHDLAIVAATVNSYKVKLHDYGAVLVKDLTEFSICRIILEGFQERNIVEGPSTQKGGFRGVPGGFGQDEGMRRHAEEEEHLEVMQVPPEDTASPRTSFSVQGLRPYTEYVFSIRCMKEDGVGYWSDWSEEKTGVTTEDKPSKGPPIWRIIDASRSPASWTVHLMWKALESFEANGVILQYEVTVRAKSSLTSPPEKYNVNTTNLTLKLPNGTYEMTVIARNRVGASPPSILLIPTSNSKAPVKNIRTLPKDGKLWVGWTAPNSYVLKYVIEWCLVSNSSDCIIEWQNEPGNVQGTYLKGDIKPFKCYLITVYPLYADGQGSGQTVKAYLQQDPQETPLYAGRDPRSTAGRVCTGADRLCE